MSRPPGRAGHADAPPAAAGSVWGVALQFGVWISPDDPARPGLRAYFAPGAFDRHLRRVAAGRAGVRLCVGHDDAAPLCSTRDGSLWVGVVGSLLMFRVRSRTADGRRAVRAARRLHGHREASVGSTVEESLSRLDGRPPKIIVLRGRLAEISLVPAGGCPGVFACVD